MAEVRKDALALRFVRVHTETVVLLNVIITVLAETPSPGDVSTGHLTQAEVIILTESRLSKDIMNISV